VNAAVLSLVIEEPGYGGDLGGRFERRFDGLLRSGRPHVYEALRSLSSQGLVERLPLEGARRDEQRSYLYRATPDGVQAWRDWLSSPMPSLARNEVLVRLASTRRTDHVTLARLLDDYERLALDEARRIPGIFDGLVDRLMAEESKALVDAKLEFVRRARALLVEQPSDR
jgi:DNA-binding PadR family transcriptional regulator